MRFVDANVILRYLLDDDPQLAEKAVKILEQGQVHVPFEVMAEIVYVMQGVYKISRQEISSVLARLIMLPNVTTNSEPVLMEALRIYADRGLDFVDFAFIERLGDSVGNVGRNSRREQVN